MQTMVAEFHTLGLAEVARGIREGRFTSEALTRGCLDRVERLESRVMAWAWLDPVIALEKARDADRQLKEGASPGRLHGAPMGIKDVIFTQGIPTEMGSPIFHGYVPEYTAAAVRKLEEAGAFVMGKTVTTEFAGQRPADKTRNPWNPAHTPGGSSSGSAAAVAAGFVPGALGTQTRGSVIRPAAYCGVVGYKPSAGIISRTGVYPASQTLDHVGMFARSVEDIALLVSCLVAHDPADPASLPGDGLPHFEGELAALGEPPRLAAVKTPLWSRASAAQKQLFLANLDQLKKAGARVEPVELPPSFERLIEIVRIIATVERAHVYGPLDAQHPGQVSRFLAAIIAAGKQVSAVQYLEALDTRRQFQQELNALFQEYDAIITLPADGEAEETMEDTGDPSFCALWTLCGVPAVTIPTGRGPKGLPLGLQVVGAYLNDNNTLKVAQWCADKIRFSIGWPA